MRSLRAPIRTENSSVLSLQQSPSDWKQGRAGSFSRLIIVAPPVMLGDLRACRSKALGARVAAEVAKDLVKIPDGELRPHLRDIVAV